MVYVKVIAPADTAALHRFGGGDAHRLLHNRLVERLENERAKLEAAEKWEDVLRQQGRVSATREALHILHQHDTPDVREMFQLPK